MSDVQMSQSAFDALMERICIAENRATKAEMDLEEMKKKYEALETPLRIRLRIEDYERRYGIWVDLTQAERNAALADGKDLRIATRSKKWLRMLNNVNEGDIHRLKRRLQPLTGLSFVEFADAIAHAHHYISEYIIHAVARIVSNQPVEGLPSFSETITLCIRKLMEPLQIV